jgi:hypothetical protein
MYSVGGARACECDPGGVPVPVGVVRVPSGQRRSAGGMRSAGANGPGGRRDAATRGRRTHTVACRGEPVTVPQQCTCGRVRIRFLRVHRTCAVGARDTMAGVCVAQYTYNVRRMGAPPFQLAYWGLIFPNVCASFRCLHVLVYLS